MRRVLNAGSGPPSNRHLHPIFTKGDWDEIRLDIDRASLGAPDRLDRRHECAHCRAKLRRGLVLAQPGTSLCPRSAAGAVRVCPDSKAGRFRLDQLPGLGDCRRFSCGAGPGCITAYMSPAGPITPRRHAVRTFGFDRAGHDLHGAQHRIYLRVAWQCAGACRICDGSG